MRKISGHMPHFTRRFGWLDECQCGMSSIDTKYGDGNRCFASGQARHMQAFCQIYLTYEERVPMNYHDYHGHIDQVRTWKRNRWLIHYGWQTYKVVCREIMKPQKAVKQGGQRFRMHYDTGILLGSV